MAEIRAWRSSLGWFAVGAVAATGVLAAFASPAFLGLVAFAGVGAAGLVSSTRARTGAPGLVSGLSIPVLYVAT